MLIKHSHRWWYYVLAILLFIATVLMLLYSPFQSANALVASGVVIAAVLAALAAFGITTVVSGMTSAQVQDYIDGKLSEFANYKEMAIESLFNNTLLGVTANGLLTMGAAFYNNVKEFAGWLIQSENIPTTETKTVFSIAGDFASIPKLSGYNENTYTNGLYVGIGYTYDSGLVEVPVVMFMDTQATNNFVLGYVQSTRYPDLCATIAISQGPLDGANSAQFSAVINYNNKYDAGGTGSSVSYYTYNGTQYALANINKPNSTQLHSELGFIKKSSVVATVYDTVQDLLDAYENGVVEEATLGITNNSEIPVTDIDADNRAIINVGAIEGQDVYGITDHIMEEVVGNNLQVSYDVEPVPSVGDINVVGYDANAIAQIQQAIQAAIESAQQAAGIQQVEIKNESPIQVITDPLILGFTLPSFDLRLNSIWYYVSGAINETSAFISFFVGMLNSVSFIYYPLYMGFVLMIVLGVYRRFLH